MTTRFQTETARMVTVNGTRKPLLPTRGPGAPHGKRAAVRSIRSLLRHIALIACAIVMLYPLLWMLVSSLRPNEEIFTSPGLVPFDLDFSNYFVGWTALSSPFGKYLINSMIIVIGAIIGNLVSCSLAAYAFARLNFRGRKIFFAIMLLTIMLPFQVVLVPQYILFSNLGWLNTFWPLILPKILGTDSFFIFLMVQFIRGIPKELDEAARIDGCGHFRTFFQVILPLMVPALATTAVFTFIWTWNEFFGAIVYLTAPDVFTVPVALGQFTDSQAGSDWGAMFAMSIVSLVPVFFAFLFGQKYLVKGIATTGLK
ncbi:carbohydrate ABC transporter permease [Paramicrobacterium chengjingii]|uniref:carbohydrate ABC transporter permease n=1 Tax=Paramicrobacterium chengjingii TaxID=2769067 RepID=UPI001F48A2B4|nr:carbohydrate ABC transporter permease [Microbacterium chengjingii]